MAVSASLRRLVETRAEKRCEYCGLSQLGQAATFHVDHIIPIVASGETTLENLALACIHCSLRKGARTLVPDPKSGRAVHLFHPREQRWNNHFRWHGYELIGVSAVGRATIEALALNSAEHWVIRSFEALLHRHPPPERGQ